MKKTLFFAGAAMLMAFYTLPVQAAPTKAKAAAKTKITDVKICPMTMEPVVGKGAGSEVVGDKRVYFCCAGCQPAFNKLPKEQQEKKGQGRRCQAKRSQKERLNFTAFQTKNAAMISHRDVFLCMVFIRKRWLRHPAVVARDETWCRVRCPGLCASTLPPCNCAMWRTIIKPKPRPPVRRTAELSAC